MRLDSGRRLPGMGHAVYRRTDARRAALLERVRDAFADDHRLALVTELVDALAVLEPLR